MRNTIESLLHRSIYFSYSFWCYVFGYDSPLQEIGVLSYVHFVEKREIDATYGSFLFMVLDLLNRERKVRGREV